LRRSIANSATPAIPNVATSIFAIGYLAAWAGFSLVAVILQWGFQRTGILSPMLVATNAMFGGFLLLAAGVYQLTPIKHACLRHCRTRKLPVGKSVWA
jgi:predicted metal-binding membrane protein